MNDRVTSAGAPIDDLCRVCKMVRRHTVQVVDGDGRPLRVVCDFCGSTHNFRGGGGSQRSAAAPASRFVPTDGGAGGGTIVSERERNDSAERFNVSDDVRGGEDLETMLRRVIREETGVTPIAPAARWEGGELILKPGREGTQEKSVPIETFFSKIVAVRNRLRVLEQQINAMEIPTDQKVKLQSYLTGCYGSLTTFNVLFAEEGDRFKGSGSR